jgi:hypothetical protein
VKIRAIYVISGEILVFQLLNYQITHLPISIGAPRRTNSATSPMGTASYLV